MQPYRNQILLRSFQVIDLLAMILAFGLATLAVHMKLSNLSLEEFLSIRISLQNIILFMGLLLSWHIIFSLSGLYDQGRLCSKWEEIRDIVNSTIVGTGAIYLASILFNIILITPLFLCVFWIVSTAMTILNRTILRMVLAKTNGTGVTITKLLMVGTNRRATNFAQRLLTNRLENYELIGFVDTEWIEGADEKFKKRYPLIPYSEFTSYLKEHVVDEVVICLPIKSCYTKYTEIIKICVQQGITVRILADFFFISMAKSRMDFFENNAVMTLYTGNMNSGMLIIKRLMDISISIVLLTVLSPLFIITAVAIKTTSPGPVFFVQKRVGLNKRLFNLYKFRTMVENAEELQKELEELNEADGPVFKIKDDPRITPLGRFLRKSSIDELPQLFNVLKGDMSLVGPRPLPVRDYREFDQDWFSRRFSVRPGITCLWQISGRSDISFYQWIEMDLDYIDNWSLSLDIRILLKTIPVVLTAKGAA